MTYGIDPEGKLAAALAGGMMQGPAMGGGMGSAVGGGMMQMAQRPAQGGSPVRRIWQGDGFDLGQNEEGDAVVIGGPLNGQTFQNPHDAIEASEMALIKKGFYD